MIIATAGHVDHGKSTLVQKLTGINTDRLQEEQDRGLTIDLGFAYTEKEGHKLGFVDVPGHVRFINNMLAGVGSVDLAMLVIAADDGIMPQTLEHLTIIEALAIPALIIVITKTDRVEHQRLSEVEDATKRLLSDSIYSDTPILRCSAMTGDGIGSLESLLVQRAGSLIERRSTGYLRLAVDRSFTVKGSGSVVTGAIRSGSIKLSDALSNPEKGHAFKVRGLHRLNTTAESALAGDRCAVNLTGPNSELDLLRRGTWLTTNPFLSARNHCDMVLHLKNSEDKPIKHWTSLHIYHAAQHTTGHIALLEDPVIDPGHAGFVQIVTQEPLTLCHGDRVIFRDQGATRTVGYGIVLDPLAISKGRAKPERINFLKRIEHAGSETEVAKVLISEKPGGLPAAVLSRVLNWQPEQITEFAAQDAEILRLDDLFVLSSALQVVAQQLMQDLKDWHQAHPNEKGLNQAQLSNYLPKDCLYGETLLKLLKTQKRIAQSGSLFHLPGTTVALPQETQRLLEQVVRHLHENPRQPPVLHDLADKMSIPPKSLLQHLLACSKSGLLVHPIKNRFFLPETFNELVELTKTINHGKAFSVQEYRDAAGIGRNLCIELLEHFDQQGLTRRDGNQRFPKT
ncbi:MAG: selenocysteine-specific translation elongation factor [Pseudomonadales bacterium]